jgi:hypothetical protein
LYLFKYKLFTNLLFVTTKNGRTNKHFYPSPFGAVVGSGMDENQDPDVYPGSATLKCAM